MERILTPAHRILFSPRTRWLSLACSVYASALHAQSLSFNSRDGRQGVSFDGGAEATLRVEGRTVTVREHEVLNRDEFSDTIVTFSLDAVTLESLSDTGWPDDSKFVRFMCKTGISCFHVSYRCTSNGRRPPSESICGANANVVSEENVDHKDFGYGQKFPCRPGECATFVSAIGRLTAPPLTAEPRAPSSVDCNALRATYAPSGERVVLPPECVTDLDRSTTYAPGAPPSTPPARPEPAIDGSKIPSRIDFPGRARSATPTAAPSDTMSPLPAAMPEPVPAKTEPPPPEPRAPRVPAREPATLNDGPSAPGTSPSRPGRTFGPLFELERARDSAKRWLTEAIEDHIANALDELQDGESSSEPGPSWLQSLVEEVVTSEAERLFGRDLPSQIAFGRKYDQLPAAFRKGKELLDATFERIYRPLSAVSGKKLVDAMAEIFDLWEEK